MMVSVTLEHRFFRTPDGSVWTSVAFSQSFWLRYLAVYDAVQVIARVQNVPAPEKGWVRADTEGVTFCSVPMYVGPWQYLRRRVKVRQAIEQGMRREGAVIMRVPSQLASIAEKMLRRTGRPYGLEVVGDPHDVFAAGAVRHPLRPFFRWWFCRQLQQQCTGAVGAAYVSCALQARYPLPSDVYVTDYSSVELRPNAFVAEPRVYSNVTSSFTLISVGSLAQYYKAPDVLIDAVAQCVREGLDVSLRIVGDGKHRPELEARAKRRGLGERVRFVGQLPGGEAVRAELDRADLFVLPSRTEGLPRAMIEAMARGLPCIGSTVGGIPELLPPKDMVPPGDVEALAKKIQEIVSNPHRLASMSAHNLQTARSYREEVLRERRLNFYQHVREATEKWLRQ